MRRANGIPIAATAVLLLVSAAPGRAEPYHNAEYRFSVELPAGWEVLSAEELRQQNAMAQKVFPGMDVTMGAGFRPVGGSFPYDAGILVQFDRRVKGKMTFEELERELKRDVEGVRQSEPEAYLRLSRRLIFDPPEFDQPRSRYTVRGSIGHGRERFFMASAGYVGPEGLVILHGFTRTGGLESDLAPFEKVRDSFRFDEPEKAVQTLLDRVFGDRVEPEWRKWIVGGVVAALVAAVGSLVMRSQPAPRRRY